jgi:hypothetical protein
MPSFSCMALRPYAFQGARVNSSACQPHRVKHTHTQHNSLFSFTHTYTQCLVVHLTDTSRTANIAIAHVRRHVTAAHLRALRAALRLARHHRLPFAVTLFLLWFSLLRLLRGRRLFLFLFLVPIVVLIRAPTLASIGTRVYRRTQRCAGQGLAGG